VWLMPSWEQTADHKDEVNCGPWSEVSDEGTPNRLIQPAMKAKAHAAVVVEERGRASGHREHRGG
jgi:hypothetical protein